MDSIVNFFLDRINGIKGIFFAYGEIPLGRRPFYPDDPVNPVWNFFYLESIPQNLRYCIYETT